ncbi:hypothetical protein [Burkholderia contaminans]|uniref:hypothetical protein n=1 Tax=Burkholderia contaminans TaxID=488447 RepID=UPI001588B58E|nr:hypothetical protein [Burkholderia contaminans]
MNETQLIIDTIESLKSEQSKRNLSMDMYKLEYGEDSTGIPSVWIYFSVNEVGVDRMELIQNINKYKFALIEELFKNGLESWPYIHFRGKD